VDGEWRLNATSVQPNFIIVAGEVTVLGDLSLTETSGNALLPKAIIIQE
jgi:hypothetical protein